MVSLFTSNLSPIPILTYHQIAMAPPKGRPFRSLYVSPADFERHMSLLHVLGYRGLSMTALLPYLRGECQGKVVGITFDDGYQNNITHAMPVLARYSFSSTCYVVSQMIGKTNSWDHDQGIPATPLMSAQELHQWRKGGQEVGGHTRHHVRLLEMDAKTSHEELQRCKLELEQVTGAAVNHFCYPYGAYAASHVEMARQAGFSTATTTQRSRCLHGEDMFQLPRVPVLRTTTRLALWLKLATKYEDRRRV